MFNFCSEIDALAAEGGDEPVRAVLTDVCALFALIHIHEVLGCRGPRHAPRAFAAARSSTRSNVPSTRLFRAVWHAALRSLSSAPASYLACSYVSCSV
jgi:hypothetical protein